MNTLSFTLGCLLSGLSVSAWGVADIRSISPHGNEYPRALSILSAYDAPFQSDDEESFFHTLEEVRT